MSTDDIAEIVRRPSVAIPLTLIWSLGTLAGSYHGYKRTKSIPWSVAWGLFSGAVPFIALPVAAIQGFGKPKKKRKGRRR
jgi:hypothetical protein